MLLLSFRCQRRDTGEKKDATEARSQHARVITGIEVRDGVTIELARTKRAVDLEMKFGR